MAAKIRKGDNVIVLDRQGQRPEGRSPEGRSRREPRPRVGRQHQARHTKPSQADPQGGIKSKEASIHVSNVALVDPTSGKPTRVGFKIDGTGDKGRKVRVAKRSGEYDRWLKPNIRRA